MMIVNDDHIQHAEMTLNDDEAFVPVPYQDTRKIWTVGYGFNLQTTPMPRKVALLWMTCILEDLHEQLMDQYSYYAKLSKIRQSVLLNMAYQLGLGGLAKFKKMHKALMVADIEGAVREMKDSKWYRNHTLRANRLIYMMRFERYISRQEIANKE